MKKILLCIIVVLSSGCVSTNLGRKDCKASMNDKSKNTHQVSKLVKSKQQRQLVELVGSNSVTWTPRYLKVKKFKKCLGIREYRGWQGYCLPKRQPQHCPDKSWSELTQMNLVACLDGCIALTS